MHDPKFEQEVQQKLEELSFSPSEAVWTRVERAVNDNKKRRVPLFWFFLLPALTLTGAGAIYFSHTRTASVITHTVAAPAGQPAVATPSASQSSPGIAPSATRTIPAVASSVKTNIPSVTASSGHTRAPATKPNLSSYTATARTLTAAPSSGTDRRSSSPDVRTENPAEAATDAAPDYQVVATEAPTLKAAVTERATLPGPAAFDHQFMAPAASRLSSRSLAATSAKAPIRLKPKYTWEAGFAGGIGASSLNKALFQQPVVMSDLAQNAAPINGRPKSYTSRIRPDLSYWAGIVVQRPLNKSLTLSLGLDLHYYSTKIQIGEKVNNAQSYPNTQSLFTMQNQLQAAAYPYYSVGDNDVFTNRYYFLELPASILWQVNHSRKLPLFWETGFSLAYLMSSNALYYNAKSAVFYKDGAVINKTQFNLTTALLVGLPIRGIRLQAGPQIQYGITTLQNQGSSGQHLFYGGLRVVLLPGKIKK